MTTCSICNRGCIPMADYDAPVCLRCDARCQPGQQPGVNIVLSAPVNAQTALVEVTA